MSVKDRTTTTTQFSNVVPRELDFVKRFTDNWDALRTIMGIMRPIRKTPGTKLVSYNATVTLQSGSVTEGDEIPYSLASVTPVAYSDVAIKKYAKAVTIESVAKYGAEIAIERTDDEFLTELQNEVLTNFYNFLKTGTLIGYVPTWQEALARAKGLVLNKFQAMRKSVTDVVGFANVLDFYNWLGNTSITTQTMFGLTYVQNFMGYNVLFLLSSNDIPQNMVIAVPVENINLYYVDPSDSEFARLGLQYTVDGETNLIGFHAQGNYNTAVGESFALTGMALWAEYLDGIAKVTVGADPTQLAEITVASAAGSANGTTHLTVSGYTPGSGESYLVKSGEEAPVIGYGETPDYTWASWNGSSSTNVTAANGSKLTVISINSEGKAVAGGSVTVVAKTT